MPADLVIEGRIATLAGDTGLGWVEALAVSGGRVVAAGKAWEVAALAGPRTRRIQLAPDEVALPGLTDAHLHLAECRLAADRPDLTSLSLEDGLTRLRRAHERLPADRWLQGRGWDVDRFGRWPTARDLEAAAPGRPIAIWAQDHHSLWVSETALKLGGLDGLTGDPAGGIIRRDQDGAPSGVLHESAARLVTDRIPAPSVEELEQGILTVAAELIALGVVAVHDPGMLTLQAGLDDPFDAYRRLADAGSLPIRVHACIRQEQLPFAVEAGLRSGDPIGPPAGRVRFGWLKLFADGTLGSQTAALLEPIEPEAGPLRSGTERGIFMTEPGELARLAEAAASAGVATMIHAIGDRAVRAALDALEPTTGRAALMPRVEHLQLVHPVDIARFGQAGIAASVQPIHLSSDAPAARRSWGARAEAFGYPWATLAGAGASLAFGTDAPVEPIDPWPGLAMAVTRRDEHWDGEPVFGPGNALSVDQAIRAACIGPAVTAAERDRGRLVAGQRADLIVIPAAALDVPVEPSGGLAAARPRLVLVDGSVAFES
ncbi:MAG: amidohydrolase [Chloroflexota bacterium]|nr:amidohydrolase [Chloroflexota bacterium]